MIKHGSVIVPKQAGISNSLKAIKHVSCKFWFHSSGESIVGVMVLFLSDQFLQTEV